MPSSVKLQVITPSKLFYEGEVELVIARTLTGEEGFMAHHSWACKLLDIGALWIQETGTKEFKEAAISGGFIDVMEDIIIYTDAAEWSSEIDKERALATKALAEKWLGEHSSPDEDQLEVERVKEILHKQESRVHVAEDAGIRKGAKQ